MIHRWFELWVLSSVAKMHSKFKNESFFEATEDQIRECSILFLVTHGTRPVGFDGANRSM
ncbi:MAG: hypothetical protein DWQ34_27735 [Planctomycetota bacterium]|nr:MAG: hypothetical protein DWQ34_27735 [Planctomycetota bacterium]REK24409.1 MAG: hypothetical protein DWQ41_15425 [Planctomycetota bacterium]REK38597.1 MAG: hypothetical protein DWQ45_04205 [Planctomycetota bacterium]